jgi:CHAT domain-containing protein
LLVEGYPIEALGSPPSLLWLPDAGADHVVELRCTARAGRSGTFELRREARRPAQARDRQRLAAQTAWLDGRRLAEGEERESMLKAQEHFEAGLALAGQLEDPLMEARFLDGLSHLHFALGNREAAQDLQQRAYQRRHGRDRHAEAISLVRLGIGYEVAGDYQKALDHFSQARALYRAEGSELGEARVLNNMSNLYYLLHDYRKALGCTLESLPVFRKYGEARSVGTALNAAGNALLDLGEPQKSLGYYRQYAAIAKEEGDRISQGRALANMGGVYQRLKQYDKALDHFRRGLALRQQVGDRLGQAYALHNMGSVYQEQGLYDKALEHYRQSMALADAMGEKVLQLEGLTAAATCERDRGQLAEARRLIESLTRLFETARGGVVSDELRIAYSGLARAAYDLDVDILMKMHAREPEGGFAAAAFEASERGRSRALLELLNEAHVGGTAGVEPALLQRAAETRRQLAAKAALQVPGGDASRPAEEVSRLEAEIARLSREYDDVRSQIRQHHPRYAALSEPASLRLGEVQALLDPDVALVEYHLGAERSYVWVATRQGLFSAALPKAEEIEKEGRSLHESLTARNRLAPGLGLTARANRLAQAEARYDRAAQRLSDLLLSPLPSPAVERLVIVADGVLHYVPFAALPIPKTWGPGEAGPLLVRHTVVSLPSATVIEALRSERQARPPAPKEVAVFADPVFDAQDGRLLGRQASRRPAVGVPRTAAASQPGLPLPRLDYTRELADALVKGLPPEAVFKAVDFGANRGAALSSGLGQYRTVVFATHGELNTQYPELSGIALSMVNEKGEPQDGLLRLADVYDLELNADLVVLAACETALGKEVKGEGLIGLSRGFFYAGSSRVLASLWTVDEDATVELLKQFHRGVREGQAFPVALREAQLQVRRQARWHAPYYWAGFVLQGEWR